MKQASLSTDVEAKQKQVNNMHSVVWFIWPETKWSRLEQVEESVMSFGGPNRRL